LPTPNASLRAHAARRVRAARGWANLSQPQLAKLLQMSVASIRRIEQEQRDVSTAELIHIGEVCEVPRHFMLHGWGREAKRTDTESEVLNGIIEDMAKRIERHERLHEAAANQLAKLDREGAALREQNPDLLGALDTELQTRKQSRKSE
jgi:transcriptional regulator with XRE-family HTH domain